MSIKWDLIGERDYKAVYKNYMLRVEEMDRGVWWWRVYYKNRELSTRLGEFATSRNRAMGLAEGLCFGHQLNQV